MKLIDLVDLKTVYGGAEETSFDRCRAGVVRAAARFAGKDGELQYGEARRLVRSLEADGRLENCERSGLEKAMDDQPMDLEASGFLFGVNA